MIVGSNETDVCEQAGKSLYDIPLELDPFGLKNQEKKDFLLPALVALTKRHYESCKEYRRIVDAVFGGIKDNYSTLEDLPFVPVSMFKQYDLRSVPDCDIVKVMTSSGTTGQQVSRVALDGITARMQSSVLIKIMQHCLGKKRLPMVIVDSEQTVLNRKQFSARAAGILGMSQFGYKPFYALDNEMRLRERELIDYISQCPVDQPIFLFGFTFIVWLHFIQELESRADVARLSIPNGILIHSGGWKKLSDQSVTAEEFRRRLKAITGIGKSFNFYGMVEQVGSVFVENPLSFLQAPIYSDVIIRNPQTLKPQPVGESGLIQVLSMLPWSYPGHSLLTEDLGILRGEDHPQINMFGKFFEVLGRVPKVEVRGCGDTYQS
jgi:hypothetical protein